MHLFDFVLKPMETGNCHANVRTAICSVLKNYYFPLYDIYSDFLVCLNLKQQESVLPVVKG